MRKPKDTRRFDWGLNNDLKVWLEVDRGWGKDEVMVQLRVQMMTKKIPKIKRQLTLD